MTNTLIKKHDPNMYWHKCTYAITLMQWDYSKIFEVEVGGNVRGFDLLETAVEVLYGDLEVDDDDRLVIELKNPDGETLLCQDDEDREEDWIKEMVVSVVLVKQEKEDLR
jgi:hypothetical protein